MGLCSGKLLKGSSAYEDMKGKELSTPLPEDLVERILAMLPFPQIFKARVLSKSWYARFSSVSSQGDEEKKRLAVSFQNVVYEWSDRWKRYGPVFLFDDFLIAYDHGTQHGRKIPFRSALPNIITTNLKDCTPSSIVGALLLFTFSNPDIMVVLNIFTGSWKLLPALPEDPGPSNPIRLVSSKDMYRVFGFYQDRHCLCARVYDSKSCAWRTVRYEIEDYCVLGRYDVYLNGVMYVMVFIREEFWGFLALDVEEETFTRLQISGSNSTSVEYSRRREQRPLVACNGTVYIANPEDFGTVMLLEVDLGGRRWGKVIRRPLDLQFGFLSYDVFSDGESVFFQGVGRDQIKLNGKVLAYNVQKDEWSSFTMTPTLKRCLRSYTLPLNYDFSTFQPGMNLFLEV